MKIVPDQDAKIDLSSPIEQAAPRRLGFVTGNTSNVPDDCDRMYEDEIVELFEGGTVFPHAEQAPSAD